jgi:hypothetical protein
VRRGAYLGQERGETNLISLMIELGVVLVDLCFLLEVKVTTDKKVKGYRYQNVAEHEGSGP